MAVDLDCSFVRGVPTDVCRYLHEEDTHTHTQARVRGSPTDSRAHGTGTDLRKQIAHASLMLCPQHMRLEASIRSQSSRLDVWQSGASAARF